MLSDKNSLKSMYSSLAILERSFFSSGGKVGSRWGTANATWLTWPWEARGRLVTSWSCEKPPSCKAGCLRVGGDGQKFWYDLPITWSQCIKMHISVTFHGSRYIGIQKFLSFFAISVAFCKGPLKTSHIWGGGKWCWIFCCLFHFLQSWWGNANEGKEGPQQNCKNC